MSTSEVVEEASNDEGLRASIDAGTITALSIAAVKGTRLHSVDAITVARDGARGDRRFFVVDERDRMVNGKQVPELMGVTAGFDEDSRELTLEFPDGTVVTSQIRDGASINARAYGEFRMGQLVDGPWADALSAHVGRPLRLVLTVSAVDRGTRGAVSLVSRASVERLAREAGVDGVDARRFRMLIEIDGVDAHAEDRWVGHDVQVGEALVRFEGHVGRCLVTSRDPDSGEITLPTLDLLRAYRGEQPTTEPLAFGIYGRVLRGGEVRVGDNAVLQP